MNLRPSNILKNVEDTVAFVAGSAGRKAKRFAHDVRIEFRARQMAAESKRLAKVMRKLDSLDAHEAAELARDQAEILGRAQQILRGKLR